MHHARFQPAVKVFYLNIAVTVLRFNLVFIQSKVRSNHQTHKWPKSCESLNWNSISDFDSCCFSSQFLWRHQVKRHATFRPSYRASLWFRAQSRRRTRWPTARSISQTMPFRSGDTAIEGWRIMWSWWLARAPRRQTASGASIWGSWPKTWFESIRQMRITSPSAIPMRRRRSHPVQLRLTFKTRQGILRSFFTVSFIK